jgi:hypothetical protein
MSTDTVTPVRSVIARSVAGSRGGPSDEPDPGIPDPVLPGGVAEVRADRFRATLAAAAGFVSKDHGRPILTGVRVEYHPGTAHCENDPETGADGYLTLVATDSYRLAVFPVPAVITGNPDPVLLGPDTVAAILALMKPGIIGRNGRNPGRVYLYNVPNRDETEPAGVKFSNGAGGETTGQSLAGEFPNYRGLIPTFNKSGGAVAINPGLVEATGKAFRVLLAGSDAPVRVSTDPHTADHPALAGGFSGRPVLFTALDVGLWPDPVPDPAAIVMPTRIYG